MPLRPYEPGTPVRRPVDVFADGSPYRYGVVLERYGQRSSMGWYDPELYSVRWNDGTEQRGFFRHGLEPVVGV